MVTGLPQPVSAPSVVPWQSNRQVRFYRTSQFPGVLVCHGRVCGEGGAGSRMKQAMTFSAALLTHSLFKQHPHPGISAPLRNRVRILQSTANLLRVLQRVPSGVLKFL